MQSISIFFNKIPIYRLTLIALGFLAFVSVIFGFLHLSSFSCIELIVSLFVLLCSCYLSNIILSRVFHIPYKIESVAITSFILFFIFSPSIKWGELGSLTLVGIVAVLSKYIFVLHKKHIFNPAAIAAVLIGLTGLNSASWWVGTSSMMWIVAIVGFVIVKRMGKLPMLGIFLITALMSIVLFNASLFRLNFIAQVFQSWPLFFLGTFMLTEPKTTPPGKNLQFIYAAVIGILFGAHFQIGPIYATPEIAIVGGNIVSLILKSVKLNRPSSAP